MTGAAYTFRLWAAGLAAAVLLVAVLVAYVPWAGHRPQPQAFTRDEISEAGRTLAVAFACVDHAFERTQMMLEKDEIPDQVLRPFAKTLDLIRAEQVKGDGT